MAKYRSKPVKGAKRPPVEKTAFDVDEASMRAAVKAGRENLARANYRLTAPKCCGTCAFPIPAAEMGMDCLLHNRSTRWFVGKIEPLGLCDRYKKRKGV